MLEEPPRLRPVTLGRARPLRNPGREGRTYAAMVKSGGWRLKIGPSTNNVWHSRPPPKYEAQPALAGNVGRSRGPYSDPDGTTIQLVTGTGRQI